MSPMADRAVRLELVPAVTAAQMREVDRKMVEDFGISLLQMMENAGRALAELTRLHLSGVRRRRVVVLAGRGGEGGGGKVAAGGPRRSGGRGDACCFAPRPTPL